MGVAGALALAIATLIFWRLTFGLKINPTPGNVSTSNAGLLDMAEHKYLVNGKIADDTDQEEDEEEERVIKNP